MHEDPRPKFYLLTGISLGVLIGTKYFGAMILISIFILHYHRTLKDRQVRWLDIIKAGLSKNIFILLFSATVAFILTTPGILLRPMSFISSQSYEITLASGMRYQLLFGPTVILSFVKNFVRAAGPFLSLVMFVGLIYPLRKRWDREIPLLAVLLPFFISFGALTTRHLIAVLPLTSLLGAYAAFHLYDKGRMLSKRAWIWLLSFWIVFGLAYNFAGILQRKDETRTKSAHYIEEHIPEGATIGATSIGDYPRWSWMFPRIDPEKYKIIDALEQPEYIILTSNRFAKMERALSSSKLHDYEWDPMYAKEWYKAHPPSEEVFRFYDGVLNEKGEEYKYRLIKTFEKDNLIPIEFPPPRIRIYKKSD